MMKPRLWKVVFIISIALNVFVTAPALVLLLFSTSIQYDLYQKILAPKLGQPKIAFIGDSITEGGYIWALRIGEYNFDVWNFGKGGFETRQMQYYAKEVAHYKSKYAFVMAGINDPDKSVLGAHKSFSEYEVLLSTLIEAGVEPIITLTLYREGEKNPAFIDELNKLLRSYANSHEITVIDLNPILCPKRSLLPQFSRDGVHLTPLAYSIWASEVRRVLDEKLKQYAAHTKNKVTG